MARNVVSPALFDITADIAGEIPLDLIRSWANSDYTEKSHQELLDPLKIKGTVVCSDSAGLSKLSGERGLIEVMKLVSEPKQVVYNYGSLAGGRAIGTWFADNTEMFYSEDVELNDLIHHLASAQKEIEKLTVQIGMSVHKGEFIELGKGLYGEDADFAEEIAESHTAGGEIVITHTIKSYIKDLKNLVHRSDLTHIGEIHSFNYKDISPKTSETKDIYPIPFSRDFYNDLKNKDFDEVEDKYTSEKIIILASVDHSGLDLLLDKLSELALSNYYMQQIEDKYSIETIKSNGQLGIFTADSIEEAIDFTKELQQHLVNNQIASKIAIAKGDVLIFDLSNGGKEIAGNPVNIASKLAEDFGEYGQIYIHDSVELPDKILKICTPIQTEISKVILKGWSF